VTCEVNRTSHARHELRSIIFSKDVEPLSIDKSLSQLGLIGLASRRDLSDAFCPVATPQPEIVGTTHRCDYQVHKIEFLQASETMGETSSDSDIEPANVLQITDNNIPHRTARMAVRTAVVSWEARLAAVKQVLVVYVLSAL
jgi:hypothetical protein